MWVSMCNIMEEVLETKKTRGGENESRDLKYKMNSTINNDNKTAEENGTIQLSKNQESKETKEAKRKGQSQN